MFLKSRCKDFAYKSASRHRVIERSRFRGWWDDFYCGLRGTKVGRALETLLVGMARNTRDGNWHWVARNYCNYCKSQSFSPRLRTTVQSRRVFICFAKVAKVLPTSASFLCKVEVIDIESLIQGCSNIVRWMIQGPLVCRWICDKKFRHGSDCLKWSQVQECGIFWFWSSDAESNSHSLRVVEYT